jgi:DNA-3-methyladenine glycosylase
LENSALREDFFLREVHTVARDLLGKILVRKYTNGRIQAGIIVEDEVYHGYADKASHASRSRTRRNEVMFGPGGHYYVYFIYGMYWNLNIVTGKKEEPSAILIRAFEPIFDSDSDISELTFKEQFRLASGPGKLCRWMGIDKLFYGKSVENEELFVIDPKDLFIIIRGNKVPREVLDLISLRPLNNTIVRARRIGVDYAGESAELEWRYYLANNKYVSRSN